MNRVTQYIWIISQLYFLSVAEMEQQQQQHQQQQQTTPSDVSHIEESAVSASREEARRRYSKFKALSFGANAQANIPVPVGTELGMTSLRWFWNKDGGY